MEEAPSSLPPLNQQMRLTLMTNYDGKTVILHNQAFSQPIDWIEYDDTNFSMYFHYQSGINQPTGLEICDDMAERLFHAKEIIVVQLDEQGLINNYRKYPFIFKEM